MKTDIEIAQEAVMEPITEVAERLESERMNWNCTENTKQNFPMSY